MKKSDLVEKFVQNKATADELQQIQRLMDEDVNFKKEILFHSGLRLAIRTEERTLLKSRLQRLEKSSFLKRNVRNLLKIAAMIAIGMGLFWFFNRDREYETLFAQNFVPYPNIVMPAVRDINTLENEISSAFSYYDRKEYGLAAEAFKKLYEEDELAYANFYYGMSLMADNQVEKAIAALENPSWDVPEQYHGHIDWYLALGYLKVENKEKATFYLEKTIRSSENLALEAQKILVRLQ